jgi:hypothetical protein
MALDRAPEPTGGSGMTGGLIYDPFDDPFAEQATPSNVRRLPVRTAPADDTEQWVLDMESAKATKRTASVREATKRSADSVKRLRTEAANAAVTHGTTEDYENTPAPPKPVYGAMGGPTPLFYETGVHWLQGESESGKSWIAFAVALDHLRAGNRVLIADYEDTRANVLGRLKALGMTAEEWSRVGYFDGAAGTFAEITDYVALHGGDYSLLVIDGVTTSLSSAGKDGRAEQDVTAWTNALPARVRSTICVDHVVKAIDSRRGMAIGSQAKKSVVTGAAYEVEAAEKFGRGQSGVIVLRLQKDKIGWLRGDGVQEVYLAFESDPVTGAVTIRVDGQPTILGRWDTAFAKLYEAGHRADVSQRSIQQLVKDAVGSTCSGSARAELSAGWREYCDEQDKLGGIN